MAAPRSSANFLSYDIRPAKQSERRIILDIIKTGGDCGLPISSYRYVGMGANRFYDFLLIHKYLGVSDMLSLEHDPKMYKRAEFNSPYSFIDVRNETTNGFINADCMAKPSILWFDYDGGLGLRMTNDISSLATKLKVGDFFFVTSYGGAPRVIDQANSTERLAWLQDNFLDLAGAVAREDCEEAAFPAAVFKVLTAALKNAFVMRRDAVFVPALQIEYADSVPMITVGGALLTEGQAHDFRAKMKRVVPFLSCDFANLYSIKSLHLTERERVVFDLAATKPRKGSKEHNKLKELGFKDKDLSAYKDLIRYLPRYVETIV